MLPGFLSINEDLSLLIDALEIQLHHIGIRRLERLAIFAFTTRIPATASTRCTCCRIGRLVNVPIMRQIDGNGFTLTRKLPTIVEERLCLGYSSNTCT